MILIINFLVLTEEQKSITVACNLQYTACIGATSIGCGLLEECHFDISVRNLPEEQSNETGLCCQLKVAQGFRAIIGFYYIPKSLGKERAGAGGFSS